MSDHYHLFTYTRLLGYPLLALTLMVFACDGCRRFKSPVCRVHITVSFLLIELWISAMINLITGEGSGGAHNFNTYIIAPSIFGCIIYIWYIIIKTERKRKKRELETNQLDCPR